MMLSLIDSTVVGKKLCDPLSRSASDKMSGDGLLICIPPGEKTATTSIASL
jgi:hypothetical protein